jgi:hypothetical protein
MISVPELYATMVHYYDNPEFTKINNTDEFSIYMCRINIQLAHTYRYLVCIVSRDAYFIESVLPLSALRWKVFQTRSMTEQNPRVKKRHSFSPKQNEITQSTIVRQSQTPQEVHYTSGSLPIELSLLANSKNLYDYPTRGTFISALETYHCIVKIV